MLEAKNLTKVYKPKKGVAVKALDGISLRFPNNGMVFLLGKSGSGKSTLLNLLGGLDRYDDGEIIIKGVSSKSFRQQHFDSYRNTYVGFIFQEYNVLEEMSVGANIALAIELQGRKADDETINGILKDVDLEGYGNRKPNELSGGQKQRVAIARALVKNPEIIMADEPTGALDSGTGRQVFNTLKKLSKSKLVIVVSHDRDFAEQYADRIIELADGKVISDVEVNKRYIDMEPDEASNGLEYEDGTVTVPAGYKLTEDDRKEINDYIEKLKSGISLKIKKNQGNKTRFVPTDNSKIVVSDGTQFKLIKSKLPLKNSFIIGASGLKYKKLRLVFTILLSLFAFTLFGFADAAASYNHINTCTNSVIDSGLKSASVKKSHKIGSGADSFWTQNETGFTETEINLLSDNTGAKFTGVYVPKAILDFSANYDREAESLKCAYDVFSSMFHGYVEMDSATLASYGYKLLAGRLPNGTADEIAISDYSCLTFEKGGYREIVPGVKPADTFTAVSGAWDMVGKTLTVSGKQYTVTGVIDTGFDISRYDKLFEDDVSMTETDRLVNYILINELNKERQFSMSGLAVVGKGKLADIAKSGITSSQSLGKSICFRETNKTDDGNKYYAYRFTSLKNIDSSVIKWFDGEKTILGEHEIIVSKDMIENRTEDKDPVTIAPEGEANEPVLEDDSSYTLEVLSYFNKDENVSVDGYKVVGYIDDTEKKYDSTSDLMIVPDSFYKEYATDPDAFYEFAISPIPDGKDSVKALVSYCYTENDGVKYPLQSAVTLELDTVNEALGILSTVFMWIGVAFAVFAALMLSNFIATSVSHKKQDIGILRAIGSRSNDVFRIFFAESFIIAMTNFVLSVIGTVCAVAVANYFIKIKTGILVTVVGFGIRQVILLLVISLVVAAAASFIPVKRIASKKPVDAIRNR